MSNYVLLFFYYFTMFLLKKKLHRVEGPVVFFQFWFFQKLKTRIDLNWHWINLKALLHPVVRGLRSCGRVPSCQAWRCLAYSERAPGVLIVAARSQRKTGRPVFRLRATRRVCDQQKKALSTCVHLTTWPIFGTQTTRSTTHDGM